MAKCTSTVKLEGTYLNAKMGDTLRLYPNHTFEYLEQLYKSRLGWTEGKWTKQNRKINFQSNHRVLVGYQLKVRPDTSVKNFEIKLLMGYGNEPVYIEKVIMYKNKAELNASLYKVLNNKIALYTTNFDSVVIYPQALVPLTLPNTLNPTHGYIAKIYPAERLYDLDKASFVIRNSKLKSKPSKKYPDFNVTFEKMGE